VNERRVLEDTSGERPDEPVMRGERAEIVKAAIARLPPKQRATLILRVYHELPHEEIAHMLGSSVGAVKANFFHALQNLKRLLSGGPLG
jgi:RNA polymerase sigma-70 factor (ECF subfamily)